MHQSEKDIFLDIAFFFNGEKKDYVVNILQSCHLVLNDGIEKLIDKCLITIDWCGYLSMHNLLQQMGEEIVKQESTQALGKHTRIRDFEDARIILTRNKVWVLFLHFFPSFDQVRRNELISLIFINVEAI